MTWIFICGAWLGAIVGIGTLLLFQGANLHKDIMKDSEDEK